MDPNTLLTVGLVVVFAIMVIFMFRNSRKRRADQEQMQEKLVPGAEVMTSHGIYGHVVSIDNEKNEAVIETTPGTRLRLHRQTLTRVIDPVAEAVDPADEAANVALDDAELGTDRTPGDGVDAAEPEFGQRTDTADTADSTDAETADASSAASKPKRAPRKRPAAE